MITAAVRLQAAVRAADSVIRMGGDEFVVVLTDIAEERYILDCARAALESLQQVMDIGTHQVRATCSIGVAIYPEGGETVEELLCGADSAMYLAKERGKNQIEVFDPVGVGPCRPKNCLQP